MTFQDDNSFFELVREKAKAARDSVGGNWLTIYDDIECESPTVLVWFDSRGVATVTEAPRMEIIF